MPAEVLWGVYHANGGLLGELAYVIGKLRGTTHCELCDITHGSVRTKPEWRALEAGLSVPIKLVHLNEQPPELADVTRGETPCVVVQSGSRMSILLTRLELAACAGSVECFEDRLTEALGALTDG